MSKTRATALVAVMLFLATVLPPCAHSQEIRAWGGHLGWTNSRQLWSAAPETDSRSGLVLGAFIEVATPLSWLGVMAEASYAQRGGRIPLEAVGMTSQDTVDTRVDYFSFPVVLTARLFRNPVGIYAYAGPAIEYFSNIETLISVASAYTTEKTIVLTGVAGGGVELLVGGRWSVRLEARVMEGLTPAFEGALGEIRHRSFELLFRAGVRPRTTQAPR